MNVALDGNVIIRVVSIYRNMDDNLVSIGAITEPQFQSIIVAIIVTIVVGLFFAGLAYLQYQQILRVNWNKLRSASQSTLSSLANATNQIPISNLSSM